MRRRRLSPEDRATWEAYRRTADPLRPDAPEAEPSPAPPVARPRVPEADPLPRPFRIGAAARAQASTRTPDPRPTPGQEAGAEPLRMDAKAHRRMTAGKLRPEGKLDLHGMTLDRAHPALHRFLMDAHGEGKRLVLVVTGKGKRKDQGGPIPERTGVLRHQVPQWLRLPPLAALVLQVREAHRSHGGGGAYYVYLRRPR